VKLSRPGAEIFVPDGLELGPALKRTTHMGVVAHPDDLEIMAWPAIRDAAGSAERWFCGVVATGGAGSARQGPYAGLTDDEMRALRVREQKKAATLGEYAAVALLDYTSAEVKDRSRASLVEDVRQLLDAARPGTVYTHNLADRHGTHVGVTLATIAACRALPKEARPTRLLGGEVWRSLDWLTDGDKVVEDGAGRENLAAALIGVFDSQISGGKRYDAAVSGRLRANATFHDSHHVDTTTSLCLAMDLSPLVADPSLDPARFAQGLVDRFAADVRDRIARLTEGS
jgi:LmbE family N-acetylglucosaminyl deacetylase